MSALLALLSLAAPPAAAGGQTATLTIQVANVRNNNGHVHVDLCDQAHFLKDGCAISRSVPSRSPTTTITVRDVPTGQYALQLFQDENDNGKTDRNMLGMPKEGIAFSRDAPIHMSAPKWDTAVIDVRPGPQTVRVTMRYFLGDKGPAPSK